MKKTARFIVLIVMIVSVISILTGCGTVETGSHVETGSTSNNGSVATKEEIPTIKVGETWVVDNQWRITVNSVKRTKYRNSYSEKNANDVIYITYSYENIGYEDNSGIMDGLYFSLEDEQIIDSEGEMGYSYPGDTAVYPQETPVGAKCSNVQNCIGLNNKSDTITINVSKYDGDGNLQKAKFVLDVE